MSTVELGLKSRCPWNAEEDSLLRKYIENNGIDDSWRNVPKRAGLMRSGKSCRLRWINYLRPDVKHGNMTADEIDLILRLHRLIGNKWSLIAGRLPGRTDNEIKNFWKCHLRKKHGKGVDELGRQNRSKNATEGSRKNSTLDQCSSDTKLVAYNVAQGREQSIRLGTTENCAQNIELPEIKSNKSPYCKITQQDSSSSKTVSVLSVGKTIAQLDVEQSLHVSTVPVAPHLVREMHSDLPTYATCTTATPSYAMDMDVAIGNCWLELDSDNPSCTPALDDATLNSLSNSTWHSFITGCTMNSSERLKDSSCSDKITETRGINQYPYHFLPNESPDSSSQRYTLSSPLTPSHEILSFGDEEQEDFVDSFNKSSSTYPSSHRIILENGIPYEGVTCFAALRSDDTGTDIDQYLYPRTCEERSSLSILHEVFADIDHGSLAYPSSPTPAWKQQSHDIHIFTNLCDETII